MDLRPHIKNNLQIQKAKELVTRGLFCYQPFIFADDLQTGVGYEFNTNQEDVGLVYWPAISQELSKNPGMQRFIISSEYKNQFAEANERLRITYNGFVDEICDRAENIARMTIADIGCNSGYFPISFSLRGAKEAVGYDRENYTECFHLLNEILGTNAKFINQSYDGWTKAVPGCKSYDVVISMMVLCHLSDILQHLNILGSIAHKAIFIWTLVAEDNDYCIRFEEPNKYYKSDKFPFCFDSFVRPSIKLLYKSLELMGFTELHEISNGRDGIPEIFYGIRNKAILAIRPA